MWQLQPSSHLLATYGTLAKHSIYLSFFDSKVPVDMKIAMVTALKKPSPDDDPPHRIQLDDDLFTKQLCDFVSINTKKLFVALDISQEFLLTHPSPWENNEEYICGQSTVMQLKVVNDVAERGSLDPIIQLGPHQPGGTEAVCTPSSGKTSTRVSSL